LKSHSWRVIDTGSLPGPQNMAIDESLFCSFDPQTSAPILRIYGWNPPALSLGRFQVPENVLDLQRCQADAMPFVRRVSGGGVIYHADELTYSIVCSPAQLPPAATVKESFRILTGFLIHFYQSLGLTACYAVDTVLNCEGLGVRTAFCFAGKESFDVMVNGNKIGGNAQRRHKNKIFQHGSIPIVNHAVTGLKYMNDRTPEYARAATSLQDCGIMTEVVVLKPLIIDAFKQCMDAEVRTCQLSCKEQSASQQLFNNKYAMDHWNLRGEAE
jgi:lipoate-protein ligase A